MARVAEAEFAGNIGRKVAAARLQHHPRKVDDANGTPQSQLRAPVVAGQTYYLQLGGVAGATGGYALSTALAPVPTTISRMPWAVSTTPVGVCGAKRS